MSGIALTSERLEREEELPAEADPPGATEGAEAAAPPATILPPEEPSLDLAPSEIEGDAASNAAQAGGDADVEPATQRVPAGLEDAAPDSSEWESVTPDSEPRRDAGSEPITPRAWSMDAAAEPPSLEFVFSDADEPAAERSAPQASGARPASSSGRSELPWVDELPDSVTPYEQRVSETVKVADLPPAEQLRGRVLANRYLAEEVLEKTAAGVSYRAYHLALDRAVTVRVLPRGLACPDEACQEVRRVAALAGKLEHPHIAATLDFGVLSDGWPYLVTEHLQGKSLAQLVAEEGRFVLRRVLHIGRQLASALAAAHEAGLVHGLLNPDNVVVVGPGTSAEVATVVGFGVSSARGATPSPPRSGVFGVPFYLSPEQASCRPLDARSDIYSLGVIFYELMTGSPPFYDGDFASVLCQHLDEEAPAPSTRLTSPGALAKAMDAIVQRCLRKDPARRYQTAAELGDDLTRLEAAAARTKRRPMPEVKRPTATIHTPPPKAESHGREEPKVIVHDDVDLDEQRISSPAPAPVQQKSSRSTRPGAPATPAPAATAAPSSGASRSTRVSPNQATLRLSSADRERILAHRAAAVVVKHEASDSSGFAGRLRAALSRFSNALRRLFAPTGHRDG